MYPVFFLYSHNIGEVQFQGVILPLISVIISSAVLILIARFLLKDTWKAAMVTSLFWVMFFAYGHVYGLVSFIPLFIFLPFWILLFIGIGFAVLRMTRYFEETTYGLNMAALCLTAVTLINIGLHVVSTPVSLPETGTVEDATARPVETADPVTHPDIYYIILDRYAANTTLNEHYQFDNSDFLSYLRQKGFYVANESSSNYPKTDPSLASSLNMTYLNDLTDTMGKESSNWTPIHDMIRDHKVWRLLRSQGYTYYHFGSWWSVTERNELADVNVNLGLLSMSTRSQDEFISKYISAEFVTVLGQKTLLRPVKQAVDVALPVVKDWGWRSKQLLVEETGRKEYNRIQYKFDELATIPDIEAPTFVFSHFLFPHYPDVFDREGNYRYTEDILDDQAYLDQLIYTNKKMTEFVDRILEKSKTPPIIIIQSDEGPWPARLEEGLYYYDFTTATEKELQKKMRILNAFYLPDVDTSALYHAITPVNTFRLIFNLYFDGEYELLPDENYVHKDHNHPYDFINVTDSVKY